MDAMISRCVDEINLSEKQLRVQRKGEEAPVYSWDTNGGWPGSQGVSGCHGNHFASRSKNSRGG